MLQGALDGGLDIPHSEKRYVGYSSEGKSLDEETLKKYILGGHVSGSGCHARVAPQDCRWGLACKESAWAAAAACFDMAMDQATWSYSWQACRGAPYAAARGQLQAGRACE